LDIRGLIVGVATSQISEEESDNENDNNDNDNDNDNEPENDVENENDNETYNENENEVENENEDEDIEGDADGEGDQEREASSSPSTQKTSNREPSSSPPFPRARRRSPPIMQINADSCTSYDIVPVLAAPHATSVNAITATTDMRWIFTGGSDGYIRKFDHFAGMNGKVPLTVAQKHPFVDSVTKVRFCQSLFLTIGRCSFIILGERRASRYNPFGKC
jgi:transcriptional activator SPT8